MRMPKLVVRILLSVFLLPLAGMVYPGTLHIIDRLSRGSWDLDHDIASYLAAGIITWIFVMIYWILVWRGALKRISHWRSAAVFCAVAAPMIAVVIGLAVSSVDKELGLRVGTEIVSLVWLISTLFFWMENDIERESRELGRTIRQVYCPKCGYDMRGQRELRCPECGAEFSVGELLELQAGVAAADAEG